MTTTYIPYGGQASQGTWREKGSHSSGTGLGFARYEDESCGSSRRRNGGGARSNYAGAMVTNSSGKRVKRIIIWFVGVLIALYAWNGFVSAQSTTTSYRVKPGDTLWSVATQTVPHRDPRVVVSQIQKLNHINGTDYIYPGEVLRLPRG